MTIYTKSGDGGDTGLFGGGRVPKDDPRVDSYGEVDELNATLGLARSMALHPELDELCQAIQDQLFTVGAVLATPRGTAAEAHIPHVEAAWAEAMERNIDRFDKELAPLTHFILPGGTPGASALHFSRTVCRRAERKVVSQVRAGVVGTDVVVYLNRLSDFLFTLARVANHRAGVADVRWIPRKA